MSALAIDMKMTSVLVQIKLIFTGKLLHPQLPLFWKGEILELEMMAHCLWQSVALNPIASLHADTGTAAVNKYVSGKTVAQAFSQC